MLNLKPAKPKLSLKIKEEEVISLEEVKELGYWDSADGLRLAKGPDWEIKIIPLNYVLKDKGQPQYFSSFETLLKRLLEHRIRYWLTQDKWTKVDEALQKAQEDISEVCKNLNKVIDFIGGRYGVK